MTLMQPLGMFGNSILLGPNGLMGAIGKIDSNPFWRMDVVDEDKIPIEKEGDSEGIQARELLKYLVPKFKAESVPTSGLEVLLHQMEFDVRPMYDGHPIYNDFTFLGEIAHILRAFPNRAFQAATTALALERNLAVRIFERDTWRRQSVAQIAEQVDQDSQIGEWKNLPDETLLKLVAPSWGHEIKIHEIRLEILEELRQRGLHKEIVDLIAQYPGERLASSSESYGVSLDRSFKFAIYNLIQNHFDEFQTNPIALAIVAKYDCGELALVALRGLIRMEHLHFLALLLLANDEPVRCGATQALETKVDTITDEDILERIGTLGSDVTARLKTVERLKGFQAMRSLTVIATGEGLNEELWKTHYNPTVSEAAKSALQDIQNANS